MRSRKAAGQADRPSVSLDRCGHLFAHPCRGGERHAHGPAQGRAIHHAPLVDPAIVELVDGRNLNERGVDLITFGLEVQELGPAHIGLASSAHLPVAPTLLLDPADSIDAVLPFAPPLIHHRVEHAARSVRTAHILNQNRVASPGQISRCAERTLHKQLVIRGADNNHGITDIRLHLSRRHRQVEVGGQINAIAHWHVKVPENSCLRGCQIRWHNGHSTD